MAEENSSVSLKDQHNQGIEFPWSSSADPQNYIQAIWDELSESVETRMTRKTNGLEFKLDNYSGFIQFLVDDRPEKPAMP